MMKTENESGQVRRLELSVLEKAVVAIIVALVLGLQGWIAKSATDTSRDIAVLRTTIAFLQRDAEKSGTDRYTASQARADFDNFSNQMNEVNRRVNRLEGKHGLE